MGKFLWSLWFGYLCFMGTAFGDEISLLFRERPDPEVLFRIAQAHGRGLGFHEIPIAHRARWEKWVDPFGVGHVAIKFKDPTSGLVKVVGWTPANVDSYEAVADVLEYFLEGSALDDKNPVRGAFHDDTDWSQGALLDPVHEIRLAATPEQIVFIANEVVRMNRTWHGYQLFAKYYELERRWRFPDQSFNCLEAMRRLLESAQIRLPFPVRPDGQLIHFVKAAKPFAEARYYGKDCAPEIAGRAASTLLPNLFHP